MFNPKDPRISVFGSTGFIGSRFCYLYKDEVIKIPRNEYTPKSKDILYLISTTHNKNVFTNPQLDINTNLIVLINVLEKCKDKNIVFNFISSSLVYGDGELPATESTVCNPKGFYGITKKCAEDLLISYCKTFNIAYRILRLCSVYGKSDGEIIKKKNTLHFLIEELKNDRPIKLYFYGDFIRDYMHLDDVVRAIYIAIKSAPINSVINIGSGVPYRFKDLIEKAQKITRSQSEIEICPSPEFYTVAEVKDIFLDVRKLNSLGFKPTITVEEGIAQLCS
ncbi:SDR family oxidoreductase [Nostoc sp. FACHB-892]|uniref:NAD-dependent epimerase/dehydratase family protein n=1 Tax=Nostoc sp. FACHB-892 TaxID=2692843 RepID=UPI0016876F64|nr:SDR family oxidoreductase [Nostoc sp. FACHB-892]MBD2726603.1 SDR family oxidoreductase [Nostoc sp. FACHB-892]